MHTTKTIEKQNIDLLKSLGVNTKRLRRCKSTPSTLKYGNDSVWAYTVYTDNSIEVNETYFSTNKAIKRHNKRLIKTPRRLFDNIDWSKKTLSKMNINDKVNSNLLGNPKLKYIF